MTHVSQTACAHSGYVISDMPDSAHQLTRLLPVPDVVRRRRTPAAARLLLLLVRLAAAYSNSSSLSDTPDVRCLHKLMMLWAGTVCRGAITTP